MKILIEKKTHPGYTEWAHAVKQGHDIRRIFGRFQYIIKSEDGKYVVSVINILGFPMAGEKSYWECGVIEQPNFKAIDILDRYKNKEDAIKDAKNWIKKQENTKSK